ncbi:RNA-binding cell elongation regulator Jag/EloR [Vagococcus vulneris]|uniref:RNA-binding protein KhpB n=1 Tax=Vagococcus vulneris TaxID=1977869 RepID=A0A429ZU39_9ENTE|nr:RNA-binding cell elongation regulator Jag/EloR [Vagococcus vulneris]RST97141.1 RNA-binding protein [Vagococcus vulneris]
MPRFTGDTAEQAIESGLKALKVQRSDALISIISEGKKGFLGIGKKLAEVSIEVVEPTLTAVTEQEKTTEADLLNEKTEIKLEIPISSTEAASDNQKIDQDVEEKQVVELKGVKNLTDEQAIAELRLFLASVAKEIGAPTQVEVEPTKSCIIFHLKTDKKGLLIGKHGKVLNALQYLAQTHIHRIAENRLTISVNVGDYRERREAILKRLADRTAKEVRETGQPVFLEPMPAFERKQVHHLISNKEGLRTYSEGKEPHRYLVVELDK